MMEVCAGSDPVSMNSFFPEDYIPLDKTTNISNSHVIQALDIWCKSSLSIMHSGLDLIINALLCG